jgi:hypothetical protein
MFFPPWHAAPRRTPNPIRRLSYRPRLEVFEDRLLLTSHLVTSNGDAGANTLRQAILDANNDTDASTISFNIPGTVTDQRLIRPASALPAITHQVVLDATTQPVYLGSHPIVLDGSNAGTGASGLTIAAGNTTVRGLVINNFNGHGIAVHVAGNNVIAGNFIGTTNAGAAAAGNGGYGVLIGSSNNTVGGTAAGDRNVISGNSISGIAIFGTGVAGNVIQGNYIGLDRDGLVAVPNATGISVSDGANNNLIGGASPGARNLIAGNRFDEISIFRDSATTGNVVQGNYIGTDLRGQLRVPNGTGFSGVAIGQAANHNSVLGNVISGNGGSGVAIFDAGTTDNVVQGNFLGTNPAGTQAVYNNFEGIRIFNGATNNTIGGTTAAARNIISGNNNRGVNLYGLGTSNNLVQGNYIGTDISGTRAIPNAFSGVDIDSDSTGGASNNTVGGTAAGAGNLISGNSIHGIGIYGGGVTGNIVQGNSIGVDVTGSVALGNASDGVTIDLAASNNLIGGTAAGARNVISGNVFDGVAIFGTGTTGNLVQNNFIGTDLSGTSALPNFDGVLIGVGAGANTIGGTAAGAGNLISGNARFGVWLFSVNPNVVQANLIGTDVTGSLPLGNGETGVVITSGSNNNTIGGTVAGAGNTIAFNYAGVTVDAATGNAIRQNSIFSHTLLGISLSSNGNHNQAFPVLTAVSYDGANTVITGTLTSAPNAAFTLEFFANNVCHPSGFGEGQIYLGSWPVMTDATGSGNFTATLASADTTSQFISATATNNVSNDTSQFAACLQVPTPSPPPSALGVPLLAPAGTPESQGATLVAGVSPNVPVAGGAVWPPAVEPENSPDSPESVSTRLVYRQRAADRFFEDLGREGSVEELEGI